MGRGRGESARGESQRRAEADQPPLGALGTLQRRGSRLRKGLELRLDRNRLEARLALEQDRRAGYYFGKDRRGQLHRVPLMTVSIGVVTNERRVFTHAAQVSELATEMKSYAKTLPGSVWSVDRRHDPMAAEGDAAMRAEAQKRAGPIIEEWIKNAQEKHKGLNAKGQLQIGALQVQGLKLANLKTGVSAAGGKAEEQGQHCDTNHKRMISSESPQPALPPIGCVEPQSPPFQTGKKAYIGPIQKLTAPPHGDVRPGLFLPSPGQGPKLAHGPHALGRR